MIDGRHMLEIVIDFPTCVYFYCRLIDRYSEMDNGWCLNGMF